MVVLVCIFIMLCLISDLLIMIGKRLGAYNPEDWRLKNIVKRLVRGK
jgi:hypothetical protein